MTTPLEDLDAYIALPRVSSLRISPDGDRLVAVVATPSPDGKKFTSALWGIDPAGRAGATRLTRSVQGESAPAFLPDGSLLFLSTRPDPAEPGDGATGDGERAGLWSLPPGGGEARRITGRPGGLTAVAAARDAQVLAFTAPVLPGAADADGDAGLRKAREDAGVSAILHEGYPVRYWDHDLGPAQQRLFAGEWAAAGEDAGEFGPARDLTTEPGRALDEQPFAVTPDGSAVLTGWWCREEGIELRVDLVRIDRATGERTVLLSRPGYDFSAPVVSPDGAFAVCRRDTHSGYDDPDDITLWLVPLTAGGGAGRDLLPDLDRWPTQYAWGPDSRTVFFTADDQGRGPVYRVDVETGRLTRLTTDSGAYTDLCPAPDGRHLYALRAAVDEPPTPVRLDAIGGGEPVRLPCPGAAPALPGRVEEVTATADDGAALRAWLVLPDRASAEEPAPLLLWVHGGPLASWNSWQWRWNPWLMAAAGYAVLLPDPALSTGYGNAFIRRGWGCWGPRPYADLMTMTDAAVKRADIDETRTAAMGGSYGGYMTNWIAGHTDRFRALVTHASLWSLEQMFGTTDMPHDWARQFGDPRDRPQRYDANSPDRHLHRIRTPMLVIHGDRDYRVPIGEALRLWRELQARGVESKFLYFPTENHWVLRPGHIRVWYSTVRAFLDQHVLGLPWRRPDLV